MNLIICNVYTCIYIYMYIVLQVHVCFTCILFYKYSIVHVCVCCSNQVEEREIPSDLLPLVHQRYNEVVEAVANVDDELAEVFLSDQQPSVELLTVSVLHVHVIASQTLNVPFQ